MVKIDCKLKEKQFRWITIVLSNNFFTRARVSRKELRANKYHANEGLWKQFIMRTHTQVNGFSPNCECSGRSFEKFSIVNFSKSNRTTFAQFEYF